MIKLFIVSNSKSKELAQFLEQRGTFSVVGSYDSISGNIVEIQNDILKVDKTLYLYQVDANGNSNVNIRSDMQYLQKMLETQSFFNPGEIVFMTQNNEQCKKAVKYFVSVMESCKYDKYKVEKVDGVISYMSVYDKLMGKSGSGDFDNKYRVLYRREKDEESSVAYNVSDNKDDLIEPFDFNGLQQYEEEKDTAVKTTTTVQFRDEANTEVEQLDSPVFEGMKIQNVLAGSNVFLMCGKSKSGLSTWAGALATSALAGEHNVLVIDYTNNSDVAPSLEQCQVPITRIRMKEYLSGRFGEGGTVRVLSTVNDKEESIRMNFIRKVFSKRKQEFDTIFVVIEESEFEQTIEILRSEVTSILFTATARRTDIVEMQKYVGRIPDVPVLVLLNEGIKLHWENYLSQEEVKVLLSFMKCKVVKSIEFNTLKIGSKLFATIANVISAERVSQYGK